jgi:hypothetical protein
MSIDVNKVQQIIVNKGSEAAVQYLIETHWMSRSAAELFVMELIRGK